MVHRDFTGSVGVNRGVSVSSGLVGVLQDPSGFVWICLASVGACSGQLFLFFTLVYLHLLGLTWVNLDPIGSTCIHLVHFGSLS